MNTNEFFSGNNLVDKIQLKVKSLISLITELKQPNYNAEFDPSICDDMYAFIKTIQSDCQKISSNNKDGSLSNQGHSIQIIHGNT